MGRNHVINDTAIGRRRRKLPLRGTRIGICIILCRRDTGLLLASEFIPWRLFRSISPIWRLRRRRPCLRVSFRLNVELLAPVLRPAQYRASNAAKAHSRQERCSGCRKSENRQAGWPRIELMSMRRMMRQKMGNNDWSGSQQKTDDRPNNRSQQYAAPNKVQDFSPTILISAKKSCTCQRGVRPCVPK